MDQSLSDDFEPIYKWHEGGEDLEGYCPGGYHPVCIGDTYSNGRYQIVHKLGFGSYSTVWLAQDSHKTRYVALKIIVADKSRDSSESRILKHLNDRSKTSHPGDSYVSSILDEFFIEDPNGHHVCLVSEPARRSIVSSKEASTTWIFPLGIARAIAAQALLGLESLHSKGVIHGDLYTRNILFRLPNIDSLTVDEIYQWFQEPAKTEIERVDGASLGTEVPPYAVRSAQLTIASQEVTDPRIMISDFGEAWLGAEIEPKRKLRTPVLFLPPEATFSKSLISFPADIWTLGCSIYDIMGERPLFEGLMPDVDDVIAEMVSCLGPLPQPWWEKWRARKEFFHEDGSWRDDIERAHDAKSRPLHLRIQEMGRENDTELLADEARSLEKMLRGMLELEPAKRATITETLKSDWMSRWGFPALEKFDLPR